MKSYKKGNFYIFSRNFFFCCNLFCCGFLLHFFRFNSFSCFLLYFFLYFAFCGFFLRLFFGFCSTSSSGVLYSTFFFTSFFTVFFSETSSLDVPDNLFSSISLPFTPFFVVTAVASGSAWLASFISCTCISSMFSLLISVFSVANFCKFFELRN